LENVVTQTKFARRSLLLSATALLAGADAACAQGSMDNTVFLSTQLRPLEEAQNVREVILKGYAGKVDYVVDEPAPFAVRVEAEMKSGRNTSSLLGALHGELQPLEAIGALAPLDDLATQLKDRGIPAPLMKLGQLGTGHQVYIPWMQATYFMVANKQALPFLPGGAKLETLTYDQLAQWAANVQATTGKRMLGFPAGPKGLLYRFFEGFLCPAYTGGIVTTFRDPAAETGWANFAEIWKHVNPNSTNYNFMQEPLLSGDVWMAFDHVTRLLDALRQKPDDFVSFPAPAGPKGRAYMPVLAGLAIAKGAPDPQGAAALIDYLSRPEVQITTAQSVGFFPVVKAELPPNLDPGLKLAVAAISATQNAPDALPSLLPIGLGAKGGEFDKVFMDTFQLIVLRGQKPHAVLEKQAEAMRRIFAETGAPCWSPDPPSTGACQVK
jgi:multiple sugar transport system substrate-binding protein